MKRVTFYNNNRSDNKLHIETEGAVVNISVNLHNREGQEVNIIEILPTNYEGWYIVGENGERLKSLAVPVKRFEVVSA